MLWKTEAYHSISINRNLFMNLEPRTTNIPFLLLLEKHIH